jgi:hypothetical protein
VELHAGDDDALVCVEQELGLWLLVYEWVLGQQLLVQQQVLGMWVLLHE